MIENTPKHIGIILDGNRRYAKKLNLKPWKGHDYGVKKVEELIDWALDIGIKELTLYTFSTENFNRDKIEINYLMNLYRVKFSELKNDKRIKNNLIRINFIGRLNLFSDEIQDTLKEIMDMTKDNTRLIINFALGYGGRSEIIDGIKKIIKDIQNSKISISEINEESFKNYLYLSNEPELIIRPGGEIRTSNFLIYQGAYSEWVFIKKFWPEITKRDILKAIEEYKKRERRFGG